jgi:hypothetical protein
MNSLHTYRTVAKVVALSKIATILRIALLLDGQVEILLADIVLALDFLGCKAGVSQAKEACVMNLWRQR